MQAQPQEPMRTLDVDAIRRQLSRLQERQANAPEASREFDALVCSAAVVDSFEVGPLFETQNLSCAGPLLKAMLERCDVGDDGRWRLRLQARRDALRMMKQRSTLDDFRQQAVPVAAPSVVQRAMDRILSGQPVPVRTLGAEDAAGLLTVIEWFDGIFENLPDRDQLAAHLAREKLLHPMRRLTGDSFVGRTAELAKLADYVGVLRPAAVLGLGIAGQGRRFIYKAWRSFHDNPPIYIAGPGGVGKSSLIAQFILTHVSAAEHEHLPFVLLDFDRTRVDSDEPFSLLIAAAQQLKAQFPAHAVRLNRVVAQLTEKRGSDVLSESSRSDSLQVDVVEAFASAVREVMGASPRSQGAVRPLLWVLDTFEEPQRKGAGTVGALWDLLTQLQRRLDFLRVVVCGRVVPPGFDWDVVSLAEFDIPSAQAYLAKRLAAVGGPVLSPADLDAVTTAVGFTPLALRLSARLISDAGTDALASVGRRRLLFFAMRAEQIQAALFHRILEHIKVVDSRWSLAGKRTVEADLRRLAFPGLAVRRVTVDVIQNVLAKPCGITMPPGYANTLYAQLTRQVDIVEPDDSDPESALAHRSDVRRMMLKDLQEHAGKDMIASINRSAVRYYAARPGLRDRAEEIYHRLRLGQAPETIARRWEPGVERFLAGAMDEIDSPVLHVFLATQLGITLDGASLQGVGQSEWEAQALLKARRYIRAANPGRALEVLRERPARLPASELLRIEAQALHLVRDESGAMAMAQRGLDEAVAAGRLSEAIELALLASQIEEGRGALDAALAYARRAEEWARERAGLQDDLRRLQSQVAVARISRKAGRHDEPQDARAALLREIAQVPRAAFRSRPALVRELVAEIGSQDLRFLQFGVELLGVDLQWNDMQALIGVLLDWDHPQAVAALAQSFGVTPPSMDALALPTQAQWQAWLHDASNRQVGRLLSALLKAAPPAPSVIAVIVSLFDLEANRRIDRQMKSRLL